MVMTRTGTLRSCDDGKDPVDPGGNSVFHRDVLAFQPHMYEEPLTGLWFVVCGSVGLFLVVWGGRAIGYALLGAVVGAFLGAFIGAQNGPEGLAPSLPIGASVGLVIVGLIGLLLPERLSASAMRKMGIAIAVLGSVSMLAIYLGASVITCSLPTRIPPLHCLPSWGFMARSLYAFDCLFLVALCFVSAERVRRTPSPRAEPRRWNRDLVI
jgi:hypothetical protein